MRESTLALIAALAFAAGLGLGYLINSMHIQSECDRLGRFVMDGHLVYDCSRRDE